MIPKYFVPAVALVAVACGAGCVRLNPDRHYACPGDGSPCEQPGYECDKASQLCLPKSDAGDAGTDGGPTDAGRDAGPDGLDGGFDAGVMDAGVMDAGVDAGVDAGIMDAGIMDAGVGEVGHVVPDEGRGTVLPAPRCTDAGWCWENPIAGDHDLLAVRGSGAEDVWAVGTAGTVLNWDGTRWQRLETGTTETLRSVWISPRGSVWVSGAAGTLLQLRDEGWVPHAPSVNDAGLNAIDGPADGGVFVVGEGQTLLARQRDGGWARQPTGVPATVPLDFHGVWAPHPRLAWAVGTNGWMSRWDGESWSTSRLFPGVNLRAVHGATPDSAFAVAEGGGVYRWDGTGWGAYGEGNLAFDLSSVWAGSANQAWMTAPAGGVFTASNNQLFALNDDSNQSLNAIWGAGAQDLWAVGNKGAITRGNDTGFREVSGGVTRDVNALWSPDGRELWAMGTNFVSMRDDAGTYVYRPNDTEPVPTGRINAISSGRGTTVAVGESGGVFLWNPTQRTWSQDIVPFSNELFGVATGTAGATWVVGNSGAIYVYNTSWAPARSQLTGNTDFRAVWAAPSPGTDVLIAGSAGMVFKRDEAATGGWARLVGAPPVEFLAIWGAQANDAWVVGEGGAAFRYTGTIALQPSTTPSDDTLRAVHGTGPSDVWAAGDNGVVIRWNGTAWATQPTGTTTNFRALWVTATDVWVAGENGAILHRARP